MSRLILQNQPDVNTPQLLQQLTTEFEQYDDPDQEYHQPLVNVEHRGSRTHLLVIWDIWRLISQQERSLLVMEAYKAARGVAAALDVSVAMGLTQDEAAQMGIEFATARA